MPTQRKPAAVEFRVTREVDLILVAWEPDWRPVEVDFNLAGELFVVLDSTYAQPGVTELPAYVVAELQRDEADLRTELQQGAAWQRPFADNH